MSEAVNAMFYAEQIADELIAQRRRRKPRKLNCEYPGLWGRSVLLRSKYADCERQMIHGGQTRRLSPREIEEFKAHVQRCIDERGFAAETGESISQAERRLFKRWP